MSERENTTHLMDNRYRWGITTVAAATGLFLGVVSAKIEMFPEQYTSPPALLIVGSAGIFLVGAGLERERSTLSRFRRAILNLWDSATNRLENIHTVNNMEMSIRGSYLPIQFRNTLIMAGGAFITGFTSGYYLQDSLNILNFDTSQLLNKTPDLKS